MNSQVQARWRLRAALVGAAVVLFCAGWAGFLAVLVKRAGASADRGGAALLSAPAPSGALLQAASAAAAAPAPSALGSEGPGAEAEPPRPRVLLAEHDDASAAGVVRHLVRGVVSEDLPAEELRRLIDEVIDEERLNHPQVEAVAAYLYEAAIYTRFAGRVTPLDAAVAHGTWAPGGDWAQAPRARSGLDNRTVYVLPKR